MNKGIFIPQQSRYETNFRYDPVDSGIINIPVDIEDANDDEIVGVLKYLSYDNLMKLKKFGSLVVKQGSSKAIIHDGLTIINDTVYKVKKNHQVFIFNLLRILLKCLCQYQVQKKIYLV